MTLYIQVKTGETYQIPGIDDFGFTEGFMVFIKKSNLTPEIPGKNVVGFNSHEIVRYWIDGEVQIHKLGG